MTIFQAEIGAPNDGDVFLKGEEIRFEGKVVPSGLGGLTYEWSVTQGTCVPSTGSGPTFATTLGSAGPISVTLSVTVGGVPCEATRTVSAVWPEVTKISWKGDHQLRKWGGGNILDPVWIRQLGGSVTKNEAGVYTKSGSATAELEVEGASPLTHCTSVQARGTGSENFYATGALFHHWTWAPGELQLPSSPLYGSVNYYDTLDALWQYRVQTLGGGWGSWIDLGQSSQLLYTVESTPDANPLYDRGVDRACRYVDGAADFPAAINVDLAGELTYTPTGCTPRNLGIFDQGHGQCCCHAAVFSILVSHVTSATPSTEDCSGGCSPSHHCHFTYRGWLGPTFQCQRPAEDGVAADPHFNFHVEVPYAGTIYDPSYGLTGWATLLETAPVVPGNHATAATFQSGSWQPPDYHPVSWTSTH